MSGAGTDRARGFTEIAAAALVNGSIGVMVSYATAPASMLLVLRMAFAGLALGEVVCVPGLDDAPAVFEQLRDLQQATLAGGNRSGRLAARYGAAERGGAIGGEGGGENPG